MSSLPAVPLDNLEILPLPAFLADDGGNIVFANRAMRNISGKAAYRNGNPSLFSTGMFKSEQDYRIFWNLFSTTNTYQQVVLPGDGRLTKKNEQMVVLYSLIEDQPSDDKYLMGVVQLKRLENVDSILSPQLLFEQIPMCLVVCDAEYELLKSNRSFLESLGYESWSSIEMQGGLRKIDLEFSPSEWAIHRKKAIAGNNPTFATNLRKRDDTLYPVQVTVAQIAQPDNPVFLLMVNNTTEQVKLEANYRATKLEIQSLRKQIERDQIFREQQVQDVKDRYVIITQSPAYKKVLHQIKQVAPTSTTVLISGETGTGKELIARTIHRHSQRNDQPFVIVNCGAMPENLIESELFGHVKGAFTGAVKKHVGRFELADAGTLFLDEIGEMPLPLQTRLLRVLQEGEITPLGSMETVNTDVRVIAATNRDLKKMVEEGTFRADLYFRLNVFSIHSIPLRERPEDISLLAEHFTRRICAKFRRSPLQIPQQAIAELMRYPFKGNVRELENIVERSVILSEGQELEIHLPPHASVPEVPKNLNLPSPSAEGALSAEGDDEFISLEEAQRRHIKQALSRSGGKVSGPGGAAELLGLNAQTLFSRMRKFSINRP